MLQGRATGSSWCHLTSERLPQVGQAGSGWPSAHRRDGHRLDGAARVAGARRAAGVTAGVGTVLLAGRLVASRRLPISRPDAPRASTP